MSEQTAPKQVIEAATREVGSKIGYLEKLRAGVETTEQTLLDLQTRSENELDDIETLVAWLDEQVEGWETELNPKQQELVDSFRIEGIGD